MVQAIDKSEIRNRDLRSTLELGGADYNTCILDEVTASRYPHVVRFVRRTKSRKVKIRTYTRRLPNEVRNPVR
jgi:hypothetical protein